MNDFTLLVAAVGSFIALVTPALVAGYLKLRKGVQDTRRDIFNTHVVVRLIDHAVNGRPVGAASIQDQIADIHSRDLSTPKTNGDAVIPLLRDILAKLDVLEGSDLPTSKE